MRDLLLNQTEFYYALYSGTTDVTDSSGYRTGEKAITYDTPVSMKANISPASGYTSQAIFGTDTQYSKTIVTCDMDCPIDENTVLWIGADPADDAFNYTVSKVARGLDNIVYAVKEVSRRDG